MDLYGLYLSDCHTLSVRQESFWCLVLHFIAYFSPASPRPYAFFLLLEKCPNLVLERSSKIFMKGTVWIISACKNLKMIILYTLYFLRPVFFLLFFPG